jgi:hypothetical protein
MSSLADLPHLVGFFSYSRSDDEHLDDALSLLRKRVRSELRLQLGRELRLWQDIEAIPLGTLWESQIRAAIAESAFVIPIVSPSAVNSSFCRMEFEAFLFREAELGRDDLVFPILYIPVPGLANVDQHGRDEVLKIIHARQYADWTEIRLDDAARASPQQGRKCRLSARACVETPSVSRILRDAPRHRRAPTWRLRRGALLRMRAGIVADVPELSTANRELSSTAGRAVTILAQSLRSTHPTSPGSTAGAACLHQQKGAPQGALVFDQPNRDAATPGKPNAFPGAASPPLTPNNTYRTRPDAGCARSGSLPASSGRCSCR